MTHIDGHSTAGISDAGRPKQDNVLRACGKGQRGQLVDLPFADGRLKAEVKFLQTFSVWKAASFVRISSPFRPRSCCSEVKSSSRNCT